MAAENEAGEQPAGTFLPQAGVTRQAREDARASVSSRVATTRAGEPLNLAGSRSSFIDS